MVNVEFNYQLISLLSRSYKFKFLTDNSQYFAKHFFRKIHNILSFVDIFQKPQNSSLRVTFPFSLLFRICLYSSTFQITHQPSCQTKINVDYAMKTFQIIELIF